MTTPSTKEHPTTLAVKVPEEVLRELDVAVGWKWVRIADNDDPESWVKVPVLRERDGRQGWIETPIPDVFGEKK